MSEKEKDDSTLTKEEAKQMIAFNDKNTAHTFYNMPFGIIGADHSKESLYQDIDNSVLCKKTCGQALAMKHGLAVFPRQPCKQSEILFVETI